MNMFIHKIVKCNLLLNCTCMNILLPYGNEKNAKRLCTYPTVRDACLSAVVQGVIVDTTLFKPCQVVSLADGDCRFGHDWPWMVHDIPRFLAFDAQIVLVAQMDRDLHSAFDSIAFDLEIQSSSPAIAR